MLVFYLCKLYLHSSLSVYAMWYYPDQTAHSTTQHLASMSLTEDTPPSLLSVPQYVKKSSLKKTSSIEQGQGGQGSSLTVKGLGKRQKSFVQFDDNAVVIDDGVSVGADKGKEKEKKGTCNK